MLNQRQLSANKSYSGKRSEPGNTRRIKLWYKKEQIDKYGSILETMMAECGVEGKKGDFSLPIPAEWRVRAEALKDVLEYRRQAGHALPAGCSS